MWQWEAKLFCALREHNRLRFVYLGLFRGGERVNPTLEELFKDKRRDISSKLIRIGCGSPASATWRKWRDDAEIQMNVQLITRWEAILLICRSQWKHIKDDYGLNIDRPTLKDLRRYGIPWFESNGRYLGDVFNMILEPPTDEHDPFWGVVGSDLPAAVKAVSGKVWSLSTIRRRCLSLGWTLKSSAKYSYAQVIKLAELG